MGKIANRYLEVLPFAICEKGFHADRNSVSESIFALANEYMGVRGTFEEGISNLDSLQGSYFNGIYDYALEPTPIHYKGIVQRTHFMVNAMDWLKITLIVDHERIDLGKKNPHDFVRNLDLKSGLLTRKFTYILDNGKAINLCFSRFLSMSHAHRGYQKISISANQDIDVSLTFHLDSNVLMWKSDCYFTDRDHFDDNKISGLGVKTLTTEGRVYSVMKVDSAYEYEFMHTKREVKRLYNFHLKANEQADFTRYVVNNIAKQGEKTFKELKKEAIQELEQSANDGYDSALADNSVFWNRVFDERDIEIFGDEVNQQGIRYTIFQLTQTYHGVDPSDNIGAKGLTGEAYSGHAFWDSETYCLPFYLFNEPEAARNLLLFRYHTLKQAKIRAKDLDCDGACYPIATLNGEEGCNLWQHASTQFQPSTGVAYGIFHYVNVTGDIGFIFDYGLEMLLEITKFLLTRGQWNSNHTHFGFYGVMGPDEFQLMVNHNTYTNYMAKATFDYTLSLLNEFHAQDKVKKLLKRIEISDELITKIKEASSKMLILFDPKTNLYEQHLGFYDLPHIDPNSIPVTDFPLYSHWSYDRIYRNDLIKQPDVLMFMFLYSSRFSLAEKKANYDFYEPKTIHESSLSPSVHSIFASEIGYEQAALDFFGFATRMDLDDYNRNTSEGLHVTSIAASWMNIVYGFAGLRSDGEQLVLNPHLPINWQGYRFHLLYRGKRLVITVSNKEIAIDGLDDSKVKIIIYGQNYEVGKHIVLPLQYEKE
ncbi:MAG TPA: glycosyl hydrolase family 65 protein [Bacilli bacterium]|nr:glycosyl hydrolase family 65 protein [Bacilli bacterium]